MTKEIYNLIDCPFGVKTAIYAVAEDLIKNQVLEDIHYNGADDFDPYNFAEEVKNFSGVDPLLKGEWGDFYFEESERDIQEKIDDLQEVFPYLADGTVYFFIGEALENLIETKDFRRKFTADIKNSPYYPADLSFTIYW